MSYRMEVYGYLDGVDTLNHLYGEENLSNDQVESKLQDLIDTPSDITLVKVISEDSDFCINHVISR